MRTLLKNLVVTHGTLLVTAVVSILCVVVSASVTLTDMWVFNHEVFPALYLSVLTPALIAPPVTFVLIRLVEQLDTAERLALERERRISEELTERKRAEEALRESEWRLGEAQRIAHVGSWEWSVGADDAFVSEEARRIAGFDRTIGLTYENWIDTLHPDDRERTKAVVAKTLADGANFQVDYRIVLPSGEQRDVRAAGEAVFDGFGVVTILRGAVQDITERKEIEEQLRHSQKMEAVGSLTGGIAHEFNNLLTVVINDLKMLEMCDLYESETSTLVQRSTRSAHHGASLTKQLLAFSRKEMLRPTVIRANELVSGSVGILRAALGEEINIKTSLAEGMELIEVDQQLLQNAILNVGLNARNAMPDGGTLTIETSSIDLMEDLVGTDGGLQAGHYVALTMTDTGHGMSPEDLERAFDPFFTTREVGEGTGLGLSMVYGFAKQSGGHAVIESEEGTGTSVRLYFPLAETAT